MLAFQHVVYDDFLTGIGTVDLSSGLYDQLLGVPDELEVAIVADQVGASTLTLTVVAQHSGDGRNWTTLGSTLRSGTLSKTQTNVTIASVTGGPALGNVRFNLTLGGSGTPASARVRVAVAARDRARLAADDMTAERGRRVRLAARSPPKVIAQLISPSGSVPRALDGGDAVNLSVGAPDSAGAPAEDGPYLVFFKAGAGVRQATQSSSMRRALRPGESPIIIPPPDLLSCTDEELAVFGLSHAALRRAQQSSRRQQAAAPAAGFDPKNLAATATSRDGTAAQQTARSSVAVRTAPIRTGGGPSIASPISNRPLRHPKIHLPGFPIDVNTSDLPPTVDYSLPTQAEWAWFDQQLMQYVGRKQPVGFAYAVGVIHSNGSEELVTHNGLGFRNFIQGAPLPMTIDALTEVDSFSKHVTATAIMKMISVLPDVQAAFNQPGTPQARAHWKSLIQLYLGSPIDLFLPPGLRCAPATTTITINDLLRMKSGISYPNFDMNAGQLLSAFQAWQLPDYQTAATSLGRNRPYSSADYAVQRYILAYLLPGTLVDPFLRDGLRSLLDNDADPFGDGGYFWGTLYFTLVSWLLFEGLPILPGLLIPEANIPFDVLYFNSIGSASVDISGGELNDLVMGPGAYGWKFTIRWF